MMKQCPTTASKPPNRDHWKVCDWCERILPADVFVHRRVATKYCADCMSPTAVRARSSHFKRLAQARARMTDEEREEREAAEIDGKARRHALIWIDATIRYARECLPADPIERLAVQLQVGRWPRFKRWDSGKAEPSHYDPTVSVVLYGRPFL